MCSSDIFKVSGKKAKVSDSTGECVPDKVCKIGNMKCKLLCFFTFQSGVLIYEPNNIVLECTVL